MRYTQYSGRSAYLHFLLFLKRPLPKDTSQLDYKRAAADKDLFPLLACCVCCCCGGGLCSHVALTRFVSVCYIDIVFLKANPDQFEQVYESIKYSKLCIVFYVYCLFTWS